MKFLVIIDDGSFVFEADDFEQAAKCVRDEDTGYDEVVGIIKLPEV